MTVWRAKINSGLWAGDQERWDGQKEYCRRVGVVGVGWGLPERLKIPDGSPLEEVLRAIEAAPGWGKTGVSTVRRLAKDVAEDDLVWTRDSAGRYWLGRIDGDWYYDASEEASRWDLNNVRPCQWLPQSMRDVEVPGAVVNSFTGRGSSLCRIDPRGHGGWRMTELIWKRETDPSYEPKPADPREVIKELADATDLEDIALLFLQANGWLLLPSSRAKDTVLYEAALRHIDDGRLAVLAVKSGRTKVPVEDVVQAAEEIDAEPFVCSMQDAFTVDPPEDAGATPIRSEKLIEFIEERRELLMPRVLRWLDP